MVIAQIIKKNPKIIRREPISLNELTEYVNAQFQHQKKTKTAVRNIFIGNKDYYQFKYVSIAWGIYGPAELNDSYKVIKYVAKKRKIKKIKLSLAYSLGISTQNYTIDTWCIFGKASSYDLEFLSYYKKFIACEFINIKDAYIDNFMFLIDINALRLDDKLLKKYIQEKNISRKYIIESFELLLNNKYYKIQKTKKQLKNKNHIDKSDGYNQFEFNDFLERSLLRAIVYAKE